MNRIVINGTFDILHNGHLNLLDAVSSLGPSHVLVLIDSDRRVQELKGADRPVNDQKFRQRMLQSLKIVDQVEIFDSEQELIDMIRSYAPHVMIKGNDYQNQPIVGQEHCGRVIFVERDHHATTNIIKKIKGIEE